MAIALDAVTTANTGNTGTSYSISHITAGANRGMLVAVSSTVQSLPTAITYAGAALTKEGDTIEVATGLRVSIWSRIQPGTGINNVVISFPSAVAAAVTIITLTDVDQIDMVDTYTGTSDSSSSPSLTMASDADEWIFDALTSTVTATVGASQTQRSNHGNAFIRGATSTEPGAASNTMSWSLSASSNWALAAVNVKPYIPAPRGVMARVLVPLSPRLLIDAQYVGWNSGPVSGGTIPPADMFFNSVDMG